MSISPFGGFDAMFTIIPILVAAGFILVFGLIIASVVRSAKQHKRNNASPVLSVPALVATKRSDTTYHHDGNTMSNSSFTTYYVTFEVESGDRMEFAVGDTEYGLLVEGDAGKLTFQGTRYLGFERNRR